MKARNYIVIQIDAEGSPVIAQGESSFYINDEELVPKGFTLDCVRNTPELKIVYVSKS